jgi:hypothetical protein
MRRFIAILLILISLVFSSGCLFVYNGDKVIRKNEVKRSVQFESEEASRIFYEKFKANLCSCQNRDSSHESVVIPFIMATNTNTKLSEAGCYNDALTACDIDSNNTITMAEVQFYSQR